MTQTFKRTGTHRPWVIFNVFLNKLKPIWTILASNEEGGPMKRGSLRQKRIFYGQNITKMAFSLRPISDARGSCGARTEFPRSLHSPTPLVPRPVLAKGQPQVLIIEKRGTLVWTLPKHTSPQPTRDDVELKVYLRQ